MPDSHLSDLRFDSLDLDERVRRGIRDAGFDFCTPVPATPPLPWPPKRVVAALSPLVLPRRLARMEGVIRRRTRRIAPVLEGLTDPHNMSAVLRSADASMSAAGRFCGCARWRSHSWPGWFLAWCCFLPAHWRTCPPRSGLALLPAASRCISWRAATSPSASLAVRRYCCWSRC